MGKATCQACQKSCKGQAIRLQESFFHVKCFKCKECRKSLATGGFYTEGGEHYCADDYQRLFGTRCHSCGEFTEGDVVTALGNTYHQTCFHCTNCQRRFAAGDKVTYTGHDYLCHACVQLAAALSTSHDGDGGGGGGGGDETANAGSPMLGDTNHVPSPPPTTSTPARPDQMDVASRSTAAPLSSPISDISSDSKPTGLANGTATAATTNGQHSHSRAPQAPMLRENSGYKSDDPSEKVHNMSMSTADGYDDVFLSPYTANQKEGLSPVQNFMQYRSPSPGGSVVSRSSKKSRDSAGSLGSRHDVNYGKFYSGSSYLSKGGSGYKRGPSINPPAQPPAAPNFHRPANFSYNQVRRDFVIPMKKGMITTLGDGSYTAVPKRDLASTGGMQNEEAIRLARYPDGQKDEQRPAPIESDNWPGPPLPAVAYPELLRRSNLPRYHARSVRSTTDEEDDDVDSRPTVLTAEEEDEDSLDAKRPLDAKTAKEIEQLSKMRSESGAAQAMLIEIERKRRTETAVPVDPRSASRTPSASREPGYGTRYESPVFASPSRDLDYRGRMRSMDDMLIGLKFRSATLPSANFPVDRRSLHMYETPVNRVRNYPVAKPGYGLAKKAATLDSSTVQNPPNFEGLNNSFRSNGSADVFEHRSHHTSQSSVAEYDEQTGLRRGGRLRGSTFSEGFKSPAYRYYGRSIPSVYMTDEPPKIYDYNQLKITNDHLPPDVERNTIECHLSDEEFGRIFRMKRSDFYRLAEWKRNDLKKRVSLF